MSWRPTDAWASAVVARAAHRTTLEQWRDEVREDARAGFAAARQGQPLQKHHAAALLRFTQLTRALKKLRSE